MGQTENVILFVILASVILLVFISSMIFFIFQYHRKRLLHEKEKTAINEQHIKELFFTKLEIQQYTMQEIGREIHDSVNQQLTLASLYSYQLESEHEHTSTGEKAYQIGAIISESMAELRALTKKLTGYDADTNTICDLVDKECRRINSLNICRVAYHFNVTNITLSVDVKNYLHRIIQEFLQNSIKYAKCKNINLDFIYNPAGLSVSLRDDGVGFDMNNYEANNKGIGLANMKKRSNLLGIGFALQSVINKGTEVNLFIPQTQLNNSRNGI